MSNQRYIVTESNIHNVSFKLEAITKSKYDSDWHSTLHAHPFTELFYVLNGSGNFLTPLGQISISQNDLIIVNPQTEHTEVSSASHPLEYIVMSISGISFVNKENPHPYVLMNFKDEKKEVLQYLNAMVDEATKQQADYELICHNLLEILIVKLLRQQSFSVETSENNQTPKDIALVKHYIETNYQQKITLEHLAELTHLNRYYIAHSFKKEVGSSPIDYLNNIRIKESCVLLTTTNYSITQIAAIVGFSNQSYFSEMFKKRMGISPSDYRKQKEI